MVVIEAGGMMLMLLVLGVGGAGGGLTHMTTLHHVPVVDRFEAVVIERRDGRGGQGDEDAGRCWPCSSCCCWCWLLVQVEEYGQEKRAELVAVQVGGSKGPPWPIHRVGHRQQVLDHPIIFKALAVTHVQPPVVVPGPTMVHTNRHSPISCSTLTQKGG